MKRRAFLRSGLLLAPSLPLASRLLAQAGGRAPRWEPAAAVLRTATDSGQVESAVLHVRQRGESATYAFGKAADHDAMFLLGSISKPIAVAAVMGLFDDGQFQLDDPVRRFLPAFAGDGRERVTLRQLLTHTSGLPDQVAENAALRQRNAPLADFLGHTLRTPLAFAPGTRYRYSSMGILLAAGIAEHISGVSIHTLVERRVLRPLGMDHSAQGTGRFRVDGMVRCQADGAAPESGGGDPAAAAWDWNSPYWRRLGAPWGGAHASAPDLGRFLDEFLHARGQALRPETARLMTRNHNPAHLRSRGLGFEVGAGAGSLGCSESTFGHTGSTGTIAWADPRTDTLCVVLTSLPSRAAKPHPRDETAAEVARLAHA